MEKTGGKIIYRKGGVLYLFRGRNYNYKTRPRFPLMLWKPVPLVYPSLIHPVAEGLTLEEATEMRQKGRKLISICKLGTILRMFIIYLFCYKVRRSGEKMVFTVNLVKNVREAFEEGELVHINCQGLNKSDYRKIGAKLRDLVPCILLSFENEHILMWRGKNWKSTLPNLTDDCTGASGIDGDSENYKALPSEAQESLEHVSNVSQGTRISSNLGDVTLDKVEIPYSPENGKLPVSGVTDAASLLMTTYEAETTNNVTGSYGEPEPSRSTSLSMTISDYNSNAKYPSEAINDSHGSEDIIDSKSCSDGAYASSSGSDSMQGTSDNSINGMVDSHTDKLLDGSGASDVSWPSKSAAPCRKGLSLL